MKESAAAFAALNRLRIRSKRRWLAASGYRSRERNAKAHGKKSSQHLTGRSAAYR